MWLYLVFAAVGKPYFRMTVPMFHTLLKADTIVKSELAEDGNLKRLVSSFYSKKHNLSTIEDVSSSDSRHAFIDFKPNTESSDNESDDKNSDDNDSEDNASDKDSDDNTSHAVDKCARNRREPVAARKRKRDNSDSVQSMASMMRRLITDTCQGIKTQLDTMIETQRKQQKLTDTTVKELSTLLAQAEKDRRAAVSKRPPAADPGRV